MRFINIFKKNFLVSILFLFLIIISIICLRFFPSRSMTWAYPDSQFYAATLLRGDASFSEISQDAYGFRAMIFRWNAYLPLDLALPNIHENWTLPTTHPPTAFLFASPIAFLSDSNGATAWAWLCLLSIVASLKLHSFNWIETILFTLLSFLWLPTIGSLGQLTPIWLLGLSLAYYFRERNPCLAGIFIAIASMTKFLPAVLIILFILKRKWAGLYSFLLVWCTTLIFIYLLSPDIFNQYMMANITASPYFIAKSGGFIFSSYKMYGLIGLSFSIGFLMLIILSNWKEFQKSKEISPKSWMIFSFVAIALLPIAWGYSYFPLYPGMLIISKIKQPVRIFGIAGLVFSSIIPVVGMIIYGLGFAWPEFVQLAYTKIINRNA